MVRLYHDKDYDADLLPVPAPTSSATNFPSRIQWSMRRTNASSLHPDVAKWIENEFRSGDSLADSLSIAATYIVLGIAGMQHVLDESEV